MGAATKQLAACELPVGRSNQRELNVPKEALGFLKRFEEQRLIADVICFGNEADPKKAEYVDVYLYDARKGKRPRSEYRLYYSTRVHDILKEFQPRVDCVTFLLDRDARLKLVFVSHTSPIVASLLPLFQSGLDSLFEVAEPLARVLELSSKYRMHSFSNLLLAYDEQLGSKTKGWYSPENFPHVELLVKTGRPDTLEPQVEKLCAELARMVNLPCASIELLADGQATTGILSLAFTRLHRDQQPKNLRKRRGQRETISLILGNQVLKRTYPEYDMDKMRKQSQHSLLNIFSSLETLLPTEEALNILEYLVFDCWIGNTDRHHENWGILEINKPEGQEYRLAPTFDHGAALAAGRNTKGRADALRNLPRFYAQGASAIYDDSGKILRFPELAEACIRFEHTRTGRVDHCRRVIGSILTIDVADILACMDAFHPGIVAGDDVGFICAYLRHSAGLLGDRFEKAVSDLESR